jgi:hypothetical protein
MKLANPLFGSSAKAAVSHDKSQHKQATIGQFGIDREIREQMEQPSAVSNPAAQEPMEHPFYGKGTEKVATEIECAGCLEVISPDSDAADKENFCSKVCEDKFYQDFPELKSSDSKEVKEASDEDTAVTPPPVEEEIQDATFFKESENEIESSPLQNAIQALQELVSSTDNRYIRECASMTIEDLQYFEDKSKVATTKSYGTGTPIVKEQPDAEPPVQEQDNPALNVQQNIPVQNQPNQPVQAAVEIKETPTKLPPRDDMRRHLDESVKKEVMQGIDTPVKVGTDKTAVKVEEGATAVCPSCQSNKHNVVDEEEGEKLLECLDCGSFFTL